LINNSFSDTNNGKFAVGVFGHFAFQGGTHFSDKDLR